MTAEQCTCLLYCLCTPHPVSTKSASKNEHQQAADTISSSSRLSLHLQLEPLSPHTFQAQTHHQHHPLRTSGRQRALLSPYCPAASGTGQQAKWTWMRSLPASQLVSQLSESLRQALNIVLHRVLHTTSAPLQS